MSRSSAIYALRDEAASIAAPVSARSREDDTYRALFMRSADANLILDGDRFVDCNDATVDMLRYERKEDLLQTHPSELSPPTQPDGRPSYEKANEMIEIALARGNHRFEWQHRRADGDVFPVEVLLTAIPRESKTILHVVWRDVSERKLLEEQLRHAMKMEAVGKLAGGIAHDFNNLLMAVIGNCDLLDRQIDPHSPHATHVAQIRKAGERAADLTRQLLAFSRKQVLRMEPLDLNDVVRDLSLILHRVAGEDVELEVLLSDEDVRIRADRGQLGQVLLNLVTNARDATPRGGRVRVETRRLSIAADANLAATRPIAMLTVTDTGCGMAEPVRRRAFDPFFTTKPLGKGTGLGLSTVYGIVKQSGADIALISAPGKGTSVKVWFPICPEPIHERRAPSAPEAKAGHETILLAEDEPLVASVMADTLRGAGYQVLVARDGAQALSLFQSAEEPIDLLLTDVTMPNLSGPELVDKLRAAGHRPKVLFASGHAANALGEGVDVIEKPFSAANLIHKVRRVLDGDGPG